MAKNGIGEILIIIGAIVTIILAILGIANVGGWGAWGFGWLGWWWGLIWGIIHIILAIGVLSGMGVLKIPFKLAKQWLVMLIIGIIILAPTSNWGGLIIIIGAILMAVL
nr:hypothetical protein [Candidatus Sigynarchaeota archaeon]